MKSREEIINQIKDYQQHLKSCCVSSCKDESRGLIEALKWVLEE